MSCTCRWNSLSTPDFSILPISAPMPAPTAMPKSGTKNRRPNSRPQNIPYMVPPGTGCAVECTLNLPSLCRTIAAIASGWMIRSCASRSASCWASIAVVSSGYPMAIRSTMPGPLSVAFHSGRKPGPEGRLYPRSRAGSSHRPFWMKPHRDGGAGLCTAVVKYKASMAAVRASLHAGSSRGRSRGLVRSVSGPDEPGEISASDRFWCPVQLLRMSLRLLGGHEADCNEVERADEPVGDAEAVRASDRVPERHGPVVLDQEQGGGGVVRDLGEYVPHLVVVGEHVDAPFGGRLAAGLGERLRGLLAGEPVADQGADLRAELNRLLLRQVAEARDLELTLRILVHGESIDDPDGVARAQPLELRDDLAVKLGMVEPEDDQLDWSNGHA